MAYLQFYQGYYTGGTPTVLSANPYDVAQDLSTGNLWQYTGNAWVAPSWNSAITFYLAGAATVCERLSSEDTKYPETIHLYIGNDSLVPADLALSADDLAIKHDLGNYSIQVSVFRQDATTDTVVEVPFPEGYVVSTEDGNWTILKNFNTYAGFDYCTVALTWTSVGGQIGPQVLDFITSAQARTITSDVITSGGYVNSDYVSSSTMLKEVVDSESTAAYIPVLSGGMCYRFTQPLTELSIGAVSSSLREDTILFSAGATQTLPSAVVLYFKMGEQYYYDEPTGEDEHIPVYKTITLELLEGADIYQFSIDDRMPWYSVTDTEEGVTYESELRGGTFTCAYTNGRWEIRANSVLQWYTQGDVEAGEGEEGEGEEGEGEEGTRTINGIVATSTDNMATWTINPDVTMLCCYYSGADISLYYSDNPAEKIDSPVTETVCDVILSPNVPLVNSQAIVLSSGGVYEMNVQYGAVVTAEWRKQSNE